MAEVKTVLRVVGEAEAVALALVRAKRAAKKPAEDVSTATVEMEDAPAAAIVEAVAIVAIVGVVVRAAVAVVSLMPKILSKMEDQLLPPVLESESELNRLLSASNHPDDEELVVLAVAAAGAATATGVADVATVTGVAKGTGVAAVAVSAPKRIVDPSAAVTSVAVTHWVIGAAVET